MDLRQAHGEQIAAARDRTLRAQPSGPRPSSRPRASCSSGTGSTCCSTRARFIEDGQLANALADRPARRRRGHRSRPGAGPPGAGGGQRPQREGRVLGRAHGGEDHPDDRGGACATSCRSSGSSTRPGARITDQVDLFPGRRGAGRIFRNQVALSGKVPQICCLFGPSAAGGAYIPAFCDLVIMVEGNASMYLGSPRMAEMVVGEKVTLEEMGGARMHAEVSGCGDQLAGDDAEAIEQAKQYFSYLPQNWRSAPPTFDGQDAGAGVQRRSGAGDWRRRATTSAR